ncbi:hypothetical protein C8J57DRAFT_1503872 [Mycena rebaudengoi]|nr:hypothetical protein C8J57DRAFT_1503872 [Mycena rebaudengoi]
MAPCTQPPPAQQPIACATRAPVSSDLPLTLRSFDALLQLKSAQHASGTKEAAHQAAHLPPIHLPPPRCARGPDAVGDALPASGSRYVRLLSMTRPKRRESAGPKGSYPPPRAAARDRCDGSTAPVDGVPCPFRQPFLLDLNATVANPIKVTNFRDPKRSNEVTKMARTRAEDKAGGAHTRRGRAPPFSLPRALLPPMNAHRLRESIPRAIPTFGIFDPGHRDAERIRADAHTRMNSWARVRTRRGCGGARRWPMGSTFDGEGRESGWWSAECSESGGRQRGRGGDAGAADGEEVPLEKASRLGVVDPGHRDAESIRSARPPAPARRSSPACNGGTTMAVKW